MKSPEAYQKLTTEIDKADADRKLSKPNVTYAEALKLPYLVACCKEGMRLHPSVGLSLPRHVPAPGMEIAGRFFPSGSRVGINAAVVQYDEGIFGSDAATFNPDRWLGDSASNMDRHMLHFGAGSRTCIGKNVCLDPIHALCKTF
jgi:cytochrome P450